jgi:hypothetical protein
MIERLLNHSSKTTFQISALVLAAIEKHGADTDLLRFIFFKNNISGFNQKP